VTAAAVGRALVRAVDKKFEFSRGGTRESRSSKFWPFFKRRNGTRMCMHASGFSSKKLVLPRSEESTSNSSFKDVVNSFEILCSHSKMYSIDFDESMLAGLLCM